MTKFLMRLWSEEQAQNMPEYALLLFLVCLTVVSTVGGLATKIDTICSDVSTHMAAAGNPALSGGAITYAAQASTQPPTDLKNAKELKPID